MGKGLAPPPIDPSSVAPVSHPAHEVLLKVALAGMSNMASSERFLTTVWKADTVPIQSAACVTNPFDLVKVRQQLQTTTVSDKGGMVRSTNWMKTISSMVKEEGVLSIYKGLSASLAREAVYSGLRMGSYDFSKSAVLASLPWKANENGFGVKLAAGMASGIVGSAVANPADLVKVRMQRLGATGSLREHAVNLYQAEGIKGFYRAVVPTMLRAGLLTASQVGVYDHAKHTLLDDFPTVFQEGFVTHFMASGAAGFAASLTSSPVDVIKVRMMSGSYAYKNSLSCAVHLLRMEGPLALYKGFTMCFLRLWPHSVVSLLIFEQLRKLAGLRPI